METLHYEMDKEWSGCEGNVFGESAYFIEATSTSRNNVRVLRAKFGPLDVASLGGGTSDTLFGVAVTNENPSNILVA